MLRIPRCPMCRTPLQPSGKYWVCPSDNFFYNLVNGVPGKPMWGVLEEESEPQRAPQQPVKEETFDEWLAEHGVTKEMYKDLDNLGPGGLKTKEDLKVAFYQRGQKDADAVLLPPR